LLTGIALCSEIDSLRERIEVDKGSEGNVMSRGGLRRDFRVTEREGSAPGARRILLERGKEALGRMYCLDAC
jgi:hypothetical protein